MQPSKITPDGSKNALFIGRFQPFHLGHLQVVRQILKKNDYLIIGIGSSENNFQPENPFTAGERFQMIKNTLDTEKIAASRYSIIPIRNIHHYALWVHHVELLTPPFTKIYTGSPLVKKLFQESGRNYQLIDIEKKLPINATLIRQKILKKADLQDLLHSEVIKFLKKIHARERLQSIIETQPFA